MDLTSLFKASVKTVRLRNKSIIPQDKSRILKVRNRDEFMLKANDIRYQVTQLRDLLIENRAAYMRLGYHLKASSHMTDAERDIIDKESEKIALICNQYINDLKSDCLKASNLTKQLLGHRLAVLDSLSNYLKSVFRIHAQQKAIRVQHELDTYKMLKLESNKRLLPVVAPRERPKANNAKKIEANSDDDDDEEYEALESSGVRNRKHPNKGTDERRESRSLNTSQSEVAIDEDTANKFAIEDELSPEDIQMFESENMQLLNDLKGLSDEVEQIEKNVVDIARLQDLFTEKVIFLGFWQSAKFSIFDAKSYLSLFCLPGAFLTFLTMGKCFSHLFDCEKAFPNPLSLSFFFL